VGPKAAPPPGDESTPPDEPQEPNVYWKVPTPYGYGAAVDGFGSVSAPLLAGFAIAVIGITVPLSADSPVRNPGTAIAVVALSVLLLLASVQCSMWARQYSVTPGDMLAWWPDATSEQTGKAARLADLRVTQWRYAAIARVWLVRARVSYDLGIIFLLLGLLVILIPKIWTPSRSVACILVGLGVLAEVAWSFAPSHRELPLVKKLFPTPLDMPLQPPSYQGPLP
jgi:hypothetical protein